MSAARITVHKSVDQGRYSVRYGTPSSFEYLGTVTRTAQPAGVSPWLANPVDSKVYVARKTRGDAVSFLADYARLRAS